MSRDTLARRFALRFAFVYAAMFTFPGPLDPWHLGERLEAAAEPAVAAIGARLLGLSRERMKGGSGDSIVGFVEILCFLLLAISIASVWTYVDRRRARPRLRDALVVYLRFVVGASMLRYGFAKAFPSQFMHPEPSVMIQPFGDLTPMTLLWSFMGFSKPYTIFTGLAEVLGATLLFFRRTATFGACLLIAVLANVVMLNLCYDVPVKVYSAHLLLFCVIIAWPSWRRLAAAFFTDAAVIAAAPRVPFASRRLEIGARVFGVALALFLIGSTAKDRYAYWRMREAPEPAWCGIYNVVAQSKDGREVPPRLDDPERWRRVVFYPDAIVIEHADSSQEVSITKRDEEKKTLDVGAAVRPGAILNMERRGLLHFDDTKPGELSLEGKLSDGELSVRLEKIDPKFPLDARGFHLFSEGSWQ